MDIQYSAACAAYGFGEFSIYNPASCSRIHSCGRLHLFAFPIYRIAGVTFCAVKGYKNQQDKQIIFAYPADYEDVNF